MIDWGGVGLYIFEWYQAFIIHSLNELYELMKAKVGSSKRELFWESADIFHT